MLLGPRVLLPVDVLYRIAPWSSLPEAARHAVPHNALIADAILQNVAWKSFASASYWRSELPLWNPYELGGLPFLAGGQSGSLYPFGVLFYLMPVELAYGPFLALHVFIGGFGAYAFARVLGCRPSAALVGGLGFAFSAFLVVSFTWPMIVSAAVWLPGMLALVELLVQGRARGAGWTRQGALALATALVVGLQVLAGHLEITLYAGFTLVFYALGRGARPLRWLGLAAVVGLALGAVQLVPFRELIASNVRAGSTDLRTVLSYALPPWQLATFLVPDFFGNPTHHTFWSLAERTWHVAAPDSDPPQTVWWGFPKNYVEAASYVGILPLLLSGCALALSRTRATFVLAALAVWSLLLAFGSPLYALLFFGVPGVDQLHTPFRWIYPYTVAVTALAALGAESLAARSPRWAGRGAIAVAVLGALGTLAAAAVFARPAPFVELAQRGLDRSGRLRSAFQNGDALLSYEWRNAALLALLVLGAGIALWLIVRRPRAGLALAAGLVAADLFAFHYDFNTRADPAPLHARLPAVEAMRADPDPFRVVGTIRGDPLTPPTAMLFGLEDVRGYDTVIPRRYAELWSLVEQPRGLEYSKLLGLESSASLASPILRLLNVRYVLSTGPIASPEVEPVSQDGMYVYRLRGALPRAFLVGRASVAPDALDGMRSPVFDPAAEVLLASGQALDAGGGGAATIAGSSPGRLSVATDADGPRYLVVSQSYFPGWRATVDGEKASVERADHALMAVYVPAGAHEVELSYKPDSLVFGGVVSALAAAVLVAGLAACAWQRLLGLAEGEGAWRRIARNAASGMGTQLFNKVIDFAFAIVVLRTLQPEGVGRYAFAIAIAGYLDILSTFGLNALTIREGAQRPGELGRLGGSSLALRLAIWLAGMPVVIALLVGWRQVFGLADESVYAALLLCLALLPGHVAGTYSALFYARERIDVPAGLTIVTTVARVALALPLLLLGYRVIGLAAVALVMSVFNAVALGALARRMRIAPSLRVDLAEARAMLGPSLPLMLNHLLNTLFFRVDVLLLQPLRGDRELGYYASAYKFVDGFGVVPSAFTFALFPHLSRLASERPDSMRRTYALGLKLLLFVSVPIALAMTAAATPLLGLLGGRTYLPDAAIALRLLIWFLPLSFANGLTQYALIAAGQQRAITGAFVIALAFNLVANLVGIPLFGYRAAALVTVLSEVALAVPFGRAVWRSIGLSTPRVLAPFVAAGGVALCVFLLAEGAAGPSGGLLGGLVVYLVVLAALRPLDELERAELAARLPLALGRRRAGSAA